jgi:hypothetical protein
MVGNAGDVGNVRDRERDPREPGKARKAGEPREPGKAWEAGQPREAAGEPREVQICEGADDEQRHIGFHAKADEIEDPSEHYSLHYCDTVSSPAVPKRLPLFIARPQSREASGGFDPRWLGKDRKCCTDAAPG